MISRGGGYRIECNKDDECDLQICSPEVIDGTITATEFKDDETVGEDAGCYVAYSILNHNFIIFNCGSS